MSELSVLISRQQIAERVAAIGAEISRDFSGENVILVGVLKGATIFLSDLARQVQLDATFDFKDMDQPIKDKNVILVEDILDTGLTLTYLKKMLGNRQPKALRVAALLDKPSRRKMPIQGDYIGFSIPDEFVVGYGLDYAERYRNLPDICVVPRGV
jgi:hypoxanthine phosphoribosyltransferase